MKERRSMSSVSFRKLVFLIFVVLFIFSLYRASRPQQMQRPKIGLALSGGGARGFAHIGVLKLLDSLHIPVDYIAGTSMGGIAGGLYAIGYSGLEIENIARNSDWEELFSDRPPREVIPYIQKKDEDLFTIELGLDGMTPVPPTGLISGQKISLLLSNLTIGYEHIKNFDRLPVPFRCVCVDLVTGNEVLLGEGSLAKALRATMSIPSVFTPVEWGDSLLIDGGIVNNIPTDVVKKMGADYIIAVDVGEPIRERDEIRNLLEIIDQAFNIMVAPRRERNLALSDITIVPELKGLAATDFESEKIVKFIAAGQQAARAQLDTLIRLRQQYQLARTKRQEYGTKSGKSPIIHGISITGNTILPFSDVYDIIGVQPGERFKSESFKARLAELRTSGPYKEIDYEVRPVKENRIRLIVHIEEREAPVIHGIDIKGNEILPFTFIYNLLGIKPLQRLNPELINKRINELYSLGYFEQITYEIKPHSQNRVRLIFHVKEHSRRRLKLGYHYDDYYRLVGTVGLQASSILIPGLRANAVIQFAGLQRFRWRMSYPSRGLNMPIFPYIRLQYKDLPVDIYGEKGQKIASYRDRSTLGALGLTLLFGKTGSLEMEYTAESMQIDPDIAFPDPRTFPSWDDDLRYVNIRFNADALDDVILPRSGIKIKAGYEASRKNFYSDLEYTRYYGAIEDYFTIKKRHTLAINGGYYWGSDSLIAYKQFYLGGPNSFVGMNYDQLGSIRLLKIGMLYRYEYKKDIFLKCMANYAVNFYDYPTAYAITKRFVGMGVGIKFLSIIGPFELVYGYGTDSIYKPTAMKSHFYFTAGFAL